MKLQFVRVGGLSSVPQKGYDASMPGFHSPPARRGIYAMVAQTLDFHLLGKSEFDPRIFEWVCDRAGRRVVWYDREGKQQPTGEYSRNFVFKDKNGDWCLARPKRSRWFTYGGELWHHLSVPRRDVLAENGSWVLTDSKAHREAFQKAFNKGHHALKRGEGFFDHVEFEVFIEKI